MKADAEDLLRSTATYYASLDSYADTGYVSMKIDGVVHRKWFSTLFRKPSLFRFTFFSPHSFPPLAHLVTQHVAGFDGNEGYSLMKESGDARAVRSTQPLARAIAGATGISSGWAHTVVRLLLPEIPGRSPLDLIDPKLTGESDMDGAPCHLITAKFPNGGEQELWIEKETSLLRRLIAVRATGRSEQLQENIRVKKELDAKLFVA